MNAPEKTIFKPSSARTRTVIVALAVFVISSLFGFKSYKEIRSKVNQSVFLLSDIKPGENDFAIKHGDECIGTFKTRYIEGRDLSSIIIDSKLYLNVEGKKITIPVSGQISINALLQVGGSFFEVKLGEESIFIGTKGVHPIELQISIQKSGDSKSFTFPLQGPILLKQNRNETYSLVMRGSDHFNRLIHHSNPFSNIQYQMTLDPNNNCGEQFNSLDISPIMRALQSIQTTFPALRGVQ